MSVRFRHLVVAALLVALPSCSVSFREPRIEPLDTDRIYETTCEPTWDAVSAVVEGLPPEIKEKDWRDDAGLITTDFAVLSDTGEEYNHLNQVAYSRGGNFIGGRYALTVTVRCLRDDESKVKVVTRIEGYVDEEFGYQVLRSTGLLETEIFQRIGDHLGTPPVATGP